LESHGSVPDDNSLHHHVQNSPRYHHLLPDDNDGYGLDTDQAVKPYLAPKIRKRRALHPRLHTLNCVVPKLASHDPPSHITYARTRNTLNIHKNRKYIFLSSLKILSIFLSKMYIWSQKLIPPICLHDEHREIFTFPLNCKFTCGNMHVSHCTPLCVKTNQYECVKSKTRWKVYNKNAQHVHIIFGVTNFQYR